MPRDRTLPPPVRRLGFQSHRRSPAPAAAALRCAYFGWSPHMRPEPDPARRYRLSESSARSCLRHKPLATTWRPLRWRPTLGAFSSALRAPEATVPRLEPLRGPRRSEGSVAKSGFIGVARIFRLVVCWRGEDCGNRNQGGDEGIGWRHPYSGCH